MPDPPRSERIKPCLLDRLTDDDPGAKHESRLQRVVPPERYVKSVVRDLLWLFTVRTHAAHTLIPADPPARALARRRVADGPFQNQEGAGDRMLSDFPEVSRSVFAYGTPDLAGLLSADMALGQLCKDLEEAVRLFEPRINPKTLRIKPALLQNGRPERPVGALACCTATSICFELQADVWLEPIPEHLHLKTVVDLDTGQYEMLDASHEPKVS